MFWIVFPIYTKRFTNIFTHRLMNSIIAIKKPHIHNYIHNPHVCKIANYVLQILFLVWKMRVRALSTVYSDAADWFFFLSINSRKYVYCLTVFRHDTQKCEANLIFLKKCISVSPFCFAQRLEYCQEKKRYRSFRLLNYYFESCDTNFKVVEVPWTQ